RFWLWRIDAARERLEAEIRRIAGDVVSHGAAPNLARHAPLVGQEPRAAAQDILKRLALLRARCERQAKSFATPMGDEMLYRYHQSLIDDTAAIGKTLLKPSSP